MVLLIVTYERSKVEAHAGVGTCHISLRSASRAEACKWIIFGSAGRSKPSRGRLKNSD